jgi:flagellin
MMQSVNTNLGAMVALQNLNSTSTQLQHVQQIISTGLRVGSAKDDGATYAIAQSQRSQVTSLDAVKDSLSRTSSVVDVAMSAGDSVTDLLSQMKEKALAASDTSLDTTSRNAMKTDFESVTGQNMSLGGSIITVATTATFATATSASNLLTTLDTSINNVSAALAKLGTNSKALENHANFVSKLQDSITAGIGNLVDADMAKESAQLQALQTKQQLGVQALSIANQSTGTVLSLFR